MECASPITQRKKVNPRNTCHSLGLSNHSPTHLPFYEPSHPFSICLSLIFPIFSSTNSSFCLPIFPHTRIHLLEYLSIHLPITHIFIHPSIIFLPILLFYQYIYPLYLPAAMHLPTHPSSHLPSLSIFSFCHSSVHLSSC